MTKKGYISPSVLVKEVSFEGLICVSLTEQVSMTIDSVVEGEDYGYL